MKNENKNVVICPPCGENVGLPTKRGAHKGNLFGPLLPRLTAVLPQSGKTNLITLLWHCVPLPPHRGEDEVVVPSLPQGREITAHGFTLIELLVVVLIIGILAAVAVPQYKKAVLKSQLARFKALVTPVAQAATRYYLENGKYPSSFSELDVEMPVPMQSKLEYPSWATEGSTSNIFTYDWGSCGISNNVWGNGKHSQYYVTCGNDDIGYTFYLLHTKTYPVGPACSGSTPLAISACKQETGAPAPFYTTTTSQSFSYSKKTTP